MYWWEYSVLVLIDQYGSASLNGNKSSADIRSYEVLIDCACLIFVLLYTHVHPSLIITGYLSQTGQMIKCVDGPL